MSVIVPAATKCKNRRPQRKISHARDFRVFFLLVPSHVYSVGIHIHQNWLNDLCPHTHTQCYAWSIELMSLCVLFVLLFLISAYFTCLRTLFLCSVAVLFRLVRSHCWIYILTHSQRQKRDGRILNMCYMREIMTQSYAVFAPFSNYCGYCSTVGRCELLLLNRPVFLLVFHTITYSINIFIHMHMPFGQRSLTINLNFSNKSFKLKCTEFVVNSQQSHRCHRIMHTHKRDELWMMIFAAGPFSQSNVHVIVAQYFS